MPTSKSFPSAGPGSIQSERGPVLILDSDPAVRRVVRLVLEGAGFACFAVATVEDARRLVAEHRPALVLADSFDASSFQGGLAGAFEADGWRPAIALMSSGPRPGRGSEDYFIRKPIEFDRLLDLLDAIERDSPR